MRKYLIYASIIAFVLNASSAWAHVGVVPHTHVDHALIQQISPACYAVLLCMLLSVAWHYLYQKHTNN